MTTWKDKLSPEALERKRERDRQRYKGANAKWKQVTTEIPNLEKYVSLWNSIADKKTWLKEQLDKYAEEHKNE